MFDYLNQAANHAVQAAKYLDQNLQAVESHLEQRLEKNDSSDPFYFNFTSSDSRILKNDNLSISEKVQYIIECADVLDSERAFLFNYAHKALDHRSDEHSGNIVCIYSYFFEYGFQPKSGTYSSENSTNTDEGGDFFVKKRPVKHYWDLIAKYFQQEYSTVNYLESEPVFEENDEKAVTWLILMLNEDHLLSMCLQAIFNSGSMMSYYDENKSYFFRNRQQIKDLTHKLYQGPERLFFKSDIVKAYRLYLNESYKKRIEQNKSNQRVVVVQEEPKVEIFSRKDQIVHQDSESEESQQDENYSEQDEQELEEKSEQESVSKIEEIKQQMLDINFEVDYATEIANKTLSLNNLIEFYQSNFGINIVKVKLENEIAKKLGKQFKKCGLCQRQVKSEKKCVLPNNLKQKSNVCSDCYHFSKSHPFLEINGHADHKRFYLITKSINCGIVQKMIDQDVIQRHFTLPKLVIDDVQSYLDGSVERSIKKVNKTLLDHTQKCNECSLIEKPCIVCKKSVKIHEIENYKQCKNCGQILHNKIKCLFRHKC